MPLGLRLGASLAITVAMVLGTLTVLQEREETFRERTDRERLMVEGLTPLLVALEGARSRTELADLTAAYRQPFVDRGYRHHHLEVRDLDGAVLATTLGPGEAVAPGDLHGVVTLSSPLFHRGRGELHVWQDASAFEADVKRRWRDRWVKILVAALSIIAAAQIAIYFLISRPLGRLVRRLDKLEMGYLGPIHRRGGPWEIRVLEWRLQRTADELQRTVQRLVAAERRALQPGPAATTAPSPTELEGPDAPLRHGDQRDALLVDYLEDLCHLMATAPRGDAAAMDAAVETWERWSLEAERMGALGLKVRLEDAALRTLDPDAFRALAREIRRLTGARRGWIEERVEHILRILGDADVPTQALQYRVKHVAGVWRKMQEKDLELDEVADLFAFRVIVAEEPDCYAALGALHRTFEPHPFRFKDYIERPKTNGYRSIHTSVRGEDGIVFEVQIRTMAMHRAAENGVAAHWTYKAGSKPSPPGPKPWWSRLSALVPGRRV